MRYAQIIMGPAGSGKSTYCSMMQRHAADQRRTIHIVNLDPAAEHFDYTPFVDIRELIQLDDVMEDEELQYGPNGGLVFCLEFLIQNKDWLQDQLCGGSDDELGGEPDDDYIIFDMPGQIELYTHLEAGKEFINLLTAWNFRICTVFLLDAQFMVDGAKFISGTFAALSVMANLEASHINILTKIDLLNKAGRDQIDIFLDPDPHALLASVNDGSAWSEKYKKLSEAIGNMITDFSLVRFIPLDISREESLSDVLLQIDQVIQYGEDCEVKMKDYGEEDSKDDNTDAASEFV